MHIYVGRGVYLQMQRSAPDPLCSTLLQGNIQLRTICSEYIANRMTSSLFSLFLGRAEATQLWRRHWGYSFSWLHECQQTWQIQVCWNKWLLDCMIGSNSWTAISWTVVLGSDKHCFVLCSTKLYISLGNMWKTAWFIVFPLFFEHCNGQGDIDFYQLVLRRRTDCMVLYFLWSCFFLFLFINQNIICDSLIKNIPYLFTAATKTSKVD